MIDAERKKKQEARSRVKKKLYAYLDAKEEAKQIKEEMAMIDADTTSPGSPDMSGMPKSGGYGDPMVGKVNARIRIAEKYHRQLEQLKRAQLEVEEMIASLPSRERRLLRYRYIDGMTWAGVSEMMAYSKRQSHRIHDRAVDRLVDMQKAAE